MGEPGEPPVRKTGALDLTSAGGLLAFSGIAGVLLLGDNVIHGFVHEALGHGLAAMAFGMKFVGLFVTAFGNNYSFDVYPSINVSLAAIQLAAGSLVSATAGFLVFLLVYPRAARRSFGAGLFTVLLCLNFETDLLYPFLSPILKYGDAYQITQLLGVPPWTFSLVMVPVAIAGFYPILREYFRLLVPHLGPIGRLPRRLLVLAAVAFLPIAANWLMVFAVLMPLSGWGVASLWSEGAWLGVGLVVPSALTAAALIRGRDMVPRASAGEARSALLSVRWYLVVSVLLVLVALAVFGPTLETSWGVHWSAGGGGAG